MLSQSKNRQMLLESFLKEQKMDDIIQYLNFLIQEENISKMNKSEIKKITEDAVYTLKQDMQHISHQIIDSTDRDMINKVFSSIKNSKIDSGKFSLYSEVLYSLNKILQETYDDEALKNIQDQMRLSHNKEWHSMMAKEIHKLSEDVFSKNIQHFKFSSIGGNQHKEIGAFINQLNNFIIKDILSDENNENIKIKLNDWAEIMKLCYENNDFQSVYAINNVLSHGDMRKHLTPEQAKLIMECETIFSSTKNMENMMHSLKKDTRISHITLPLHMTHKKDQEFFTTLEKLLEMRDRMIFNIQKTTDILSYEKSIKASLSGKNLHHEKEQKKEIEFPLITRIKHTHPASEAEHNRSLDHINEILNTTLFQKAEYKESAVSSPVSIFTTKTVPKVPAPDTTIKPAPTPLGSSKEKPTITTPDFSIKQKK